MGDIQVEGVDYFEKYAPVVSWTTVRRMLKLNINQVWANRQVYFSNAYFRIPCHSMFTSPFHIILTLALVKTELIC